MVTTVAALTGWGRTARRVARVHRLTVQDDVSAAIASASSCAPVTVRGSGLSYGDAALPCVDGGNVLDMSGRTGVVSLDLGSGIVVVQSGMTLRRLSSLVSPHGWRVPVLPGAGDVTVGGAVASDVHGKNQPGAGTFGRHVTWLTLVHPDGTEQRIGPDLDPDAFWATVGGLGLTGVIDLVALRLVAARGTAMVRHRLRAGSLAQCLSLLETLAHRQEHDGQLHVVAWLDAVGAAGRGRALIDVCRPADDEHAAAAQARPQRRRARRPVRSLPGAGLVWRPAIRAADATHWWLSPTVHPQLLTADRALLPLDGISWWPAAFGSKGLVQYQLLLPDTAVDELPEVLHLLRWHRVPPALAVLKRFTGSTCAPLGFVDQGWSLALDFPRRWAALEPALQSIDDLVTSNGGRVYLTKDSRLTADHVAHMYPRLGEWRRDRDRLDPTGRMTSSLGVRLGLVSAP
jgi:decaprenylphospho-beta-D-ribofuranose 2-oxidase